eukprot:scaffold188475_cov14-Tisochrysis_lutea.AAC.1
MPRLEGRVLLCPPLSCSSVHLLVGNCYLGNKYPRAASKKMRMHWSSGEAISLLCYCTVCSMRKKGAAIAIEVVSCAWAPQRTMPT